MPHVKKAELLEGEVYLPSPVRHTTHGRPHFYLITWLGAYGAATPGVDASDHATLRLDWRNEVQPDVLLRLAVEAGGHSRLSEEGYVEGAPELVVEVASSSAALDLHAKKEIYGRSGVQEYLVWRTLDEQIDWFELREGEYGALKPDQQGRLRSRVFPGLWLAVPPLLAGDLALVLAELHQGVAADEHTTFVQRLPISR
jgi:Uma2 family endonuclease